MGQRTVKLERRYLRAITDPKARQAAEQFIEMGRDMCTNHKRQGQLNRTLRRAVVQ